MEKHLLERLTAETPEETELKSGQSLDRKIYSSGNDFIINEKQLLLNERSISVRTHTRYTVFPSHKHNYLEMMIVLEGNITHRIGDDAITLGKGEIIIMNKHTSHSLDLASAKDIGVNIIMSDSFIDSVITDLSGTVFSSLFKENAKSDGAPLYLHFKAGGEKSLENLIENLLIELTSDSGVNEIMAKTVALFLTYLSSYSERLLLGGNATSGKETKRALEVISYIKSSYRTASLNELSKKMYLSAPYLSKIIKEHFGKSFKELVVDERIEKATEMLISTGMSVTDVIRAVGYENESYFHREFKRRTGKTPLSLRKSSKGSRRLAST